MFLCTLLLQSGSYCKIMIIPKRNTVPWIWRSFRDTPLTGQRYKCLAGKSRQELYITLPSKKGSFKEYGVDGLKACPVHRTGQIYYSYCNIFSVTTYDSRCVVTPQNSVSSVCPTLGLRYLPLSFGFDFH